MSDDASRKRDLFGDSDRAPELQRPMRPPVLPVSRFVASARLLLERQLGLMWISGEISGCTRAASGHLYFTLKDPTAQVRCVFFKHKAQGLAFTLREGLAVEVRAVPSIYDARGEFQLNVETVRLAGLGALYERFVQMKTTLAAAGWFDAGRKRALPPYPRRIGIVTSQHAAALRDVLTTLRRRFPGAPVVLYPASVQGAGAAREIAAAIALANAHRTVDVLIVCRGGGSIEDLWAFNEEIVARAVFESALPIVSGVGHETDFTICDFVADVRAATPTGAAALVVPERAALRSALVDWHRRLHRAAHHRHGTLAQRLDAAARRLVHPAARVAQRVQQIETLGSRLVRALGHGLERQQRRVDTVRARLVRELRTPLPQSARLALAARALERGGRVRIAQSADTLSRLGSALALLNPQAVLDRGYSIVTRTDGSVVVDAHTLVPGEVVRLALSSGAAGATVSSVDPD